MLLINTGEVHRYGKDHSFPGCDLNAVGFKVSSIGTNHIVDGESCRYVNRHVMDHGRVASFLFMH